MGAMSAPAPRPASLPTSVFESLMREPDAAHLVQRAQWLELLDQRLRAHLPPALRVHARLTNVARGHLVYLVDSANWHTRLRLASGEVLDAARALGLEVFALNIRIAAQPWQGTARHLAAIDAGQRRRFGTSAAEGRTLREVRAVLEEGQGSHRTDGVSVRR